METIKESAINYVKRLSCDELFGRLKAPRGAGVELTEAFSNGVAWAERWIPVEEELPKDTKPVLVRGIVEINPEKPIVTVIGRFYKSGFQSSTYYKVTPTHWRLIDHK